MNCGMFFIGGGKCSHCPEQEGNIFNFRVDVGEQISNLWAKQGEHNENNDGNHNKD